MKDVGIYITLKNINKYNLASLHSTHTKNTIESVRLNRV